MSSEPSDVDAWGITHGYHDIFGDWHPTSDETRSALREAMGTPGDAPPLWFVRPGDEHELAEPTLLELEGGATLGPITSIPPDLPLGYHLLRPGSGAPPTELICAPARCPDAPPGWGVACQLYAAMSLTSQGIGDFADLTRLARWVGSLGGETILLSPLHAPAPAGPVERSPYSPASRAWRNPLHLRVEGVPPSRPAVIDRDAVWQLKQEALRSQFAARRDELAWREWAFTHRSGLDPWAAWCASVDGVGDADFHRWLQWMIDEQLAEVRTAAPEVSLIGDLAIGFSPDGADASNYAGQIAHGCRIGAPPDAFNTEGQDWGLPPFVPWRLRACRYEPFIHTIRGALRGLQGLRIDHVMGLFRQYWIPPDASARDGAYVRFAADELLSIVALEATRAGAFVIGEDLGTVEEGVRDTMRRYNVLGTEVALFTDAPPPAWPDTSLATIATHDLPTLAGVWHGADGDPELLHRMESLTGLRADAPVEEAAVAAHAALAQAPCPIRLGSLDDITLAEERPNVPGTVWERPNWSLPLPVPLEELERSPVARRVMLALAGTP